MKITEYRIAMPLTVDEFQKAQIYNVSASSKEQTGGGSGVEVVESRHFDNTPLLNGKYNSGQYTKKIYHMKPKMPRIARWTLPDVATRIYEESWNAYPYCRTVLSTPEYKSEEKLYLTIESMHLPDTGEAENACGLNEKKLKRRQIVHLDICNDKLLTKKDLNPENDPKQLRGIRGPLAPGWQASAAAKMCAYKTVQVKIGIIGLGWLERMVKNQYPRLFAKFHRECVCTIDTWYPMSLEDLRRFEQQTQEELDRTRNVGELRGMAPED